MGILYLKIINAVLMRNTIKCSPQEVIDLINKPVIPELRTGQVLIANIIINSASYWFYDQETAMGSHFSTKQTSYK